MKITVFTPAYNRGYIIENLYHSLQRQSFGDFEWIIIDDGSTDNTEELFLQWMKEENDFPIIYQKVKNGGKHRAINKGIQIAKGELFFIVDSDDYLSDDSLEQIVCVENSIPEDEKKHFAGVCGLRAYPSGKSIGSSFDGKYLDITTLDRTQFGIGGDKAEVFYTAILKQYPFPEIDGENFITECVVWDKIAFDGYKLRFFNENIYFCDYLQDGLTHQGDQLLKNNPVGWGIYVYQSIVYGKTQQYEIRSKVLEYYRECGKKLGTKQVCEILHLPVPLLVCIDFAFRVSEKTKQISNRMIQNKMNKYKI